MSGFTSLENNHRAVAALEHAIDGDGVRMRGVTKRGNPVLQFTLNGDRVKNCGRAVVCGEHVMVWHTCLPNGLGTSEGFARKEYTQQFVAGLGGRGPTVGHLIKLDKLEQQPERSIVRPKLYPERAERPEHERPKYENEQVRAVAMRSLAQHGWVFKKSSNGIDYANDGEGSSLACRLVVKDGLAQAWSHRGEIELGPPWRKGKDMGEGIPTQYAVARDLIGSKLDTEPLPALPVRQTVERGSIKEVQAEYARLHAGARACPKNHRHLTKQGAQLSPDDAVVVGPGEKHSGAILIPALRPLPDAASALEVCGGYVLLPRVSESLGTDKLMLRGSQPAGAFLPIDMLPSVDGKLHSFQGWMQQISKTPEQRNLPIVLCEGWATAKAVHESGAGHAICCFSSNNVGPVARWLAKHEHDQTHGLVIATDNDIGLTRDGVLASKAVPSAIAVAREVGADVAFPGKSYRVGDDARDILASCGPEAVRRFIERAQKPDEVQARFDACIATRRAPPAQEVQR